MRPFSFTLLIYLLFSLSGKGFQSATPPHYHIQHFSDENGLPQNSVKQIITDQLGFIWLASEGGLVRFDGSSFQVYTKIDLGIPSDRITSFRRDLKNGDLYAISESNRLITLKNGTILRDTVYSDYQPIDHIDVESMIRSSRSSPTKRQIKALEGLNYHIIPGTKNNFFVYYNQTISFCQSGQLKAVIPFKGTMSFVPPSLQWTGESPLAYIKGSLNVGHFLEIDGYLFYHHVPGEGFIQLTPTFKKSGLNSQQHQIALTGDIERNPAFSRQKTHVKTIWNAVNRQAFALLNNHFYRIHYSGGQLKTSLLIKDFDFVKNSIVSAYFNESNGSIFLGSITKGLFLLTPTTFKTLSISEKDGNNIFYAQAPYTRESVVTPQGYVLARNTAPLKLIPDMKGHTLSNKFALLKDRRHYLWFIINDFIYKCSPDGKKEVSYWDMKHEPSKLYQGTDEGIWVGFKSGTVAYLTENQQKKLTQKIVTKIPNEEITWLYQSNPDHIWIGTAHGLYSFNLKENIRRHVSSLTGKNIRSLYASAPNQLWITTYGDGLYLLENNRLTSLPSDLKKHLNYAHCIVEDDNGYFWITTNKGLFQTRKQDLLRFAKGELSDVFYKYYTKDNGFLTNEFNGGCQPCGIKLADSTISLPSLNGLVWFKPHLVKTASLNQTFVIQNVMLDGRNVRLADTLELPYNAHNLTLSVVTPYFGNTNNLNFSYMLTKVGSTPSEQWMVPNNQTISINNLTYGKYILTIRKAIGFGNQYIKKEILIHVPTPWFLRWWFIGVSILSFLALIFALVNWRTRYIVRLNRRLNLKITQRTAELTEALNELRVSEKTQQKQLQIQARIIGVLSHDLRTPLKYISTNSKKYQHQIETALPDFKYLYIGKSISESTDKVYKLTDNLLTYIKATIHKEGVIKNEQVNIYELLAEKSSLFAQIAQENQTHIRVKVEKELTVNTTRQLLEIIIHNLIDNAVKSTWNGTITLLAQRVAQQTCISVIDTGSGMPPELADWLSKSAKNTDSPDLLPAIGLGLIEVREIADLLDIRISLETGNSGTRVHLTL